MIASRLEEDKTKVFRNYLHKSLFHIDLEKKKAIEWNFLLTIGIWKRWGGFNTMEAASHICAVKVWIGRTKKWKNICSSLKTRHMTESFLERIITNNKKWVLFNHIQWKWQWLWPQAKPVFLKKKNWYKEYCLSWNIEL